MPVYIDQTGRNVTIASPPKRIISLVPSQTELLFDLGLNEEVIGITKFCVHPAEWFRTKTRVGGTKQIKPGIIHQLNPDLIIANKEENVREQVEELAAHYPVWISDITNLDDAYQMMEQIGSMTNKEEQAGEIIKQVKEKFSGLRIPLKRPRAAYLIWQKPYMTVGHDTFIHAIMNAAGLENVFGTKERYPEITIDEIRNQQPELLLLSSEPFPFKQKHAEELKTQLPGIKIILVDGEMFSWYGSRLLLAPAYFANLQHQIK